MTDPLSLDTESTEEPLTTSRSKTSQMRMGPILLAALCLWSCALTVTPLLNEEQVRRANNYIQQQFAKDFNYQYAYFVRFTADECNRGLTNQVLREALKNEDADDLYQKVNNYGIYEGNRMVAASFLEHEHYTDHSEYRLLTPDNNSPIRKLLGKEPVVGCAIFYSLNSPCITKCIRPNGNYNIINLLQSVTNIPQDKVFAFGKVFRYDAGNPETWTSWRTLNDYMPLYRCNGNNCIHCFKNGVQQNNCMD
ncbi:uncharacterized protein LOC122935597 [Bufo gargarizans]|uniref:uncharacterized protein LOC122935597 n=1 Tax=Bufo gargarizans TaxID=30331 RepID=UPI001CF293C8|nr:uncharacterized protein LOC122935597 [Bufo gargarizans]